ncbi:exo-beta-N-acetylmuramidase NamZ domain-containing protein [Fodinicola feengrottensis]|uniref:exo-beta-N-acetylmuramidase NamZ domain-containing protein n=1 Tax=Fodinicola feengrottensis TaxID=435914 RepID=UPI0036F23236
MPRARSGSPDSAVSWGRAAIPIRHGLTYGELARWLNTDAIPADAGRPADLRVIEMTGWDRRMLAADTGQPWVFPVPEHADRGHRAGLSGYRFV